MRVRSLCMADPLLTPGTFDVIGARRARQNAPRDAIPGTTAAVQLVYDRFYVLLFGALVARMREHGLTDARLVAIAGSGAMGQGLRARAARGAVAARLRDAPWIRAYGNLVEGVGCRLAGCVSPFEWIAERRLARELWSTLRASPAPSTLRVDGIELLDLLIDSYLRLRPSPRFDACDPLVLDLLCASIRAVRRANAWFAAVRPRVYLTSYTSYLMHGVPVRVALAQGIPVWSFGNLGRFGKRLTEDDPFHTRDASDYARRFAALPGAEARLDEARAGLESRLAGTVDAATSYMRRSAYAYSDSDLPEGLAGSVVVFLHDFYDSPHVFQDLVFPDFWRWLAVTVETLEEAGIACFLKPHPNQIVDSDHAVAEFRAAYPAARWLTAEASNARLARAGIACGVTVYGTVAHELAYLGVPSIACARHPHHSFGFCRTARSLPEYKALLRDARVAPLPRETMQREALAFYYMHNLEGSDVERELRDGFVEFWRASNVKPCTDERLLDAFRRFVGLPSFTTFARALIS
jgi:hypothetical protein